MFNIQNPEALKMTGFGWVQREHAVDESDNTSSVEAQGFIRWQGWACAARRLSIPFMDYHDSAPTLRQTNIAIENGHL